MFESKVRSLGDLAGVFQYDGDAGYFYLYKTSGEEGRKVEGAIRILTTEPNYTDPEIQVRWNADERWVGLFIRKRLAAAFDGSTGTRYAPDQPEGTARHLPAGVLRTFAMAAPAPAR